MKLTKIEIHKYKSFESKQEADLDDNITILVDMNESGKTSALEAIAKTNYFQDDEAFKFSTTHDYPRKEKKKMDKSGSDPNAITCTYELDSPLVSRIERDIGKGSLKSKTLKIATKYGNGGNWSGISIDRKLFVSEKTKELDISSKTLNEKLENVQSLSDLKTVQTEYTDEKYVEGLSSLECYFENKWNWHRDPLGECVARKYIKPSRPKFLHYDEYFSLPSRISVEKLQNGELEENEYKTARALFELADIDTAELLESDDFEDFIAELEATESIIAGELFKYWGTNKNLNIVFHIDKKRTN